MLTKTSVSAIRALTYLGLHGSGEPLSPRVIAEQLGESPTYLAKIMRLLVRAGILRAHRGVTGGVTLGQRPEDVTLLAIVEACQGMLLADYCEETDQLAVTCAFHQAAAELHRTIVEILSRWNLADLLARPRPSGELANKLIQCSLVPTPRSGDVQPTGPPSAVLRVGPSGSVRGELSSAGDSVAE